MSEPSKTDPVLALFAELDEDARRITAIGNALGELGTVITGTRLRARIGRLQARLNREDRDEGDNGPLTVVLNYPKPSPAQQKAMENPVTIDPPQTWRRRR